MPVASASRPALRPRLTRPELALVAVTMLWGASFLLVHVAMREEGALAFVGLRFVAAGAMLALLFRREMARLTPQELAAGAAIGLAICLGYGAQTYGLKTISSSQSAFITAAYVPLVPLLQWAVLKRPPGLMSWVAVGLAFTGLLLLAGPDAPGLAAGGLGFGAGEVVTLFGTLAMAAEILLIGAFAGRVNGRRVTVVQLLAAGMFALIAMPFAGEGMPDASPSWFAAALGLGLMSAVIQLTMNWAQAFVSPTRATLIYAGEPVWAGIVGRLAGERLPPLALLGAALILAGTLVGELRPVRRTRAARPPAE
ncbi:DMT family transporter [Azorhizobium doebereinerae]|uniref:DMT family transporter n=1 Tax=Azorhizobium doebereinerae TaxID=281091 RepID=UPI00040F1E1E|nr:DMT family transporter [Azorhizobium doebereinerae]